MRNVILITADALRADRLSRYGYEREITPNLDAFAGRFMHFTSAYTAGPHTSAAFQTILGGIYPLAADNPHRLPEYAPSLPDTLRRAGYHTAAFHSNAYLSRYFGFRRGFDVFFDYFPERKKGARGSSVRKPLKRRIRESVRAVLKRSRVLYGSAVHLRDLLLGRRVPYLEGDALNMKVLEHLDHIVEPFFLWIHYMDTHNPYLPDPKECMRITGLSLTRSRMIRLNRLIYERDLSVLRKHSEELNAIYDAQVYALDRCVGFMLDVLEDRGFLQDSIVAFTSDHGEELLDHGDVGHHNRFYEEEIRVPLIMNTGRGRSDDLISLIDLPVELILRAEVEVPEGFMGKSMDKRPYTFCETGSRDAWRACLRTSRWKLHWYRNADKVEFYDLKEDPRETNDLVGTRKEGVRQMKKLLEAHVKEVRTLGLALRATITSERIYTEI